MILKTGDRVACGDLRATVVSEPRLLVGYGYVVDILYDDIKDRGRRPMAQWVTNLRRISALEELAECAE